MKYLGDKSKKNIIIVFGIMLLSTVTVIGAKYPENNDMYSEELVVINNPVNYAVNFSEVMDVLKEDFNEKNRVKWERAHAGKVKQLEMTLESLNNIKDIPEEKEKEIYKRALERHRSPEEEKKPVITKSIEVASIPKSKGTVTKTAEMATKKSPLSKGFKDMSNLFEITAYDLSYNSCEKTMEDPWYGITANGHDLKGTTRESAMTVAADTNVIPMGSRVRLEFADSSYQKFDGIYTVRDRGGAIKGAKIDLFMGDFNKHETDQSVWNFGRVKAKVYLIRD